MRKFKLLDLFCGAGGASMGYYRAGFEVEGVDIKPQPHYPFKFYQADALEFPLEGYDAYHASPPCQRFSSSTLKINRNKHPDLVGVIRERLIGTRKHYVIENVYKAPLKATLMLCGSMFDLPIVRHRYFEISLPDLIFPPCTCNHKLKIARQGYAPKNKKEGWCITRSAARLEGAGEALGIDWMERDALQIAEAIPPAYTEYIGKYLMEFLANEAPTVREE